MRMGCVRRKTHTHAMSESSYGSELESAVSEDSHVTEMAGQFVREWLRIGGMREKIVDELEMNDEDVEAVVGFANAFDVSQNPFKVFCLSLAMVAHAAHLAGRYGETGFGNKPPEMNRFAYWAAHVPSAVFDRTNEVISKYTAEATVYENTKSPSASPKCSFCKEKIAKGSLAFRRANVEFLINHHVDFEPRLKQITRVIACSQCVRGGANLGLANRKFETSPPLIVDVQDAKFEMALQLANAAMATAHEGA